MAVDQSSFVSDRNEALESAILALYPTKPRRRGPGHQFVGGRALQFSAGPPEELLEAAGLTDGLTLSGSWDIDPVGLAVPNGDKVRKEVLAEAGFDPNEQEEIEHIISEAQDTPRANEARALSDARNLLRWLPVTIVLCAGEHSLKARIEWMRQHGPEGRRPFLTATANREWAKSVRSTAVLYRVIEGAMKDPDVARVAQAIDPVRPIVDGPSV